jgi:ABC-type oligopeptide transport system ATPase subunit
MAQSSTRDLEQYMQQVRQAPYQAIPESILTDTRNEARLINTVVPFLTDSMDVVRGKAYYIIKRIGQKSSNQTVRQQAVHQLVIGVRDPNSGNSGNNSDALTGFYRLTEIQ